MGSSPGTLAVRFWIAAPERVGQNASSHGFRTCPTVAPRQRQGPDQRMEARLEWGPAGHGLRCTSTLLTSKDQDEPGHPPDLRGLVGSPCYRCGWCAPGIEPRRGCWRVCNHRSIRPDRCEGRPGCETGSLVRGAAPGERGRCTADQRRAPCLGIFFFFFRF